MACPKGDSQRRAADLPELRPVMVEAAITSAAAIAIEINQRSQSIQLVSLTPSASEIT